MPFPNPFTGAVRTELDIAATPEAVWQVMLDTERHAEWSEFLRFGPAPGGGPMQVGGGRIRVTAGGMAFNPKLLRMTGKELRWRGQLGNNAAGGLLFSGDHFFEIAPAAGGRGTALVHGEVFTGLLVPLLPRRTIEANFEKWNAALAARAERQA